MAQTSKRLTGPVLGSPIGIAAHFIIAFVGLVGLVTVLLGAWRPNIEPSDFAADYSSARAWSQGVDPYGDTPTLEDRYVDAPLRRDIRGYTSLHPPLDILITWPFSRLPFRVAYVLWMIVMGGTMTWAMFAFEKAIGLPSSIAVAAAFGLLALPTTRLALHNGEPNPLVLALLVAAWLLLRSEREAAAGFLLGIATAMRIFPALLLLLLLQGKRYRAAAWQAGSAATLTALAGVTIGIDATRRWLSGSRTNITFWRAAGHNISVLGVPFRWLTRNTWFPGQPNEPLLASLVAGALIIVGLYLVWRSPARTSGDRYWAAVPFMILLSPIAWADYLILVYPLVVLVLRQLHARNGVLVIAGSLAVVLGRPIFAFSINPVSVVRQVLVLSIPLYGLISLAISDWIPTEAGADIGAGQMISTNHTRLRSTTP